MYVVHNSQTSKTNFAGVKLIFQDFKKIYGLHFCSDFRYESNGKFVLGVGFFSSDKFRLFN